MKTALIVLLFLFGYPTAIFVIFRYVPVVRERRTRWFVLHELAVAAICAGHALNDNLQGVLVNGAWGVSAAIWYGLGPRLRRARSST